MQKNTNWNNEKNGDAGRFGDADNNPSNLKRFPSGGYGSGMQDEQHRPTISDEHDRQGYPKDSAISPAVSEVFARALDE